MTLEIAFLLATLAGMVLLFVSEALPFELTAFIGLVILVVAGYLEPNEVFDGFSSPAVITILSGFFLSASLKHTGVADAVGGRIRALVGDREPLLVPLVMGVAASLSAFMPNVAATAVLLPPVASVARQTGVPASRLFMPLAVGTMLGGTLTLIGTPANIVAAQVIEQRGLTPFGFFSITPFGAALVVVGTVVMATIGRRLLPRTSPSGPPTGADLARIYGVDRRLFSIRVPEGSTLDGATLREARLGSALRINVLARVRDGDKTLAPAPDTTLREGDVLIVKGRREHVEELLRMRGLEMREGSAGARLREASGFFTGVLLRVGEGSAISGRTVQELRFRERYGGLIAAVWRDGERVYDRPGGLPLEEGDELLVLGDRAEVEELAASAEFELEAIGPPTMARLEEAVFQVRVTPGSALDGVTVRESRIGELMGLTIVGRIPRGGKLIAATPEQRLTEDDTLLVSGEPTRVANLLRYGDVEVLEAATDSAVESGDVRVVEAVVGPRSGLAGHTLRGLDFRERYGLQVLALLRADGPLHEGLADRRLEVGDTLLLQGEVSKLVRLGPDPDFLVLTPGHEEDRNTRKAPLALGALALMVGLAATGVQPIHVAAFEAAVLVVLVGALTMEQAYREIDWSAVFLVAAVLPMGVALERSGAALWIAEAVVGAAGRFGPHALLVVLMVTASLMSQILTGAPTVVVLAPVVFVAAERAGVAGAPLLMGVTLASSMTFLTPFSHRANLLVMNAGGYRGGDFFRVGSVLTLLTLGLLAGLVPWLMPL